MVAIKIDDEKAIVAKNLRMRIRDFRNGIQKCIGIKSDKIVSKEMWETMSDISGQMATLNEQMVKALKLNETNSIDASIQSDMRDISAKCIEMTLTPAQRKAKAKKVAELDAQIAELMRQKADL